MSQMPNAWGPPPAPRRRRTGLYIAITVAAATGAFFAGGAIGQDDDGTPSGSACKQAMQRDYDAARLEIAAGGDPDTDDDPPIECMGVDDKTLTRYVGEIVDEAIGKGLEDAWSSPTPTP